MERLRDSCMRSASGLYGAGKKCASYLYGARERCASSLYGAGERCASGLSRVRVWGGGDRCHEIIEGVEACGSRTLASRAPRAERLLCLCVERKVPALGGGGGAREGARVCVGE